MLKPYQRYTVTSHIKSVSLDELSQAGDTYPEPIIDRYLQVPDDLPEQVKLLAEEVTKEAETPYDKVIAIKNFLNKFKYDLTVEPPPEGVDGVEYFLFDAKEGTCVNFTSSMVVMLRSLGVPSRICTGYLKGEFDSKTEKILLRGRNYHAWAEVYFPEFGWIEVETTSSGYAEGEETIVGAGGESSEVDDFPFMIDIEGPGSLGTAGPLDTTPKSRAIPNLSVYFLIIGVMVLLYFAARLVINNWVQRLKRVRSAIEAYAKMCYVASLGKSGPLAYETPLEYSTRLIEALPAEAEDINNVTDAYVDTLYSPRKELGQHEKARLQKSWVELCPRLLRSILHLRGYTAAPKPLALGVITEEAVEEEELAEEEEAAILYRELAAGADEHYIICEDLFKIYKIADLEVVALRGLDLRVKQGEFMAIVGASGSGKTTLLNILGGLDTPSAGRVTVGGQDLLRTSGRDLVKYRRKYVGFIWQQVGGNLIPYLTVFQNVELPLILLGWPLKKRRIRVEELLEAVGLGERMHHKPEQLSGGEQQRVAIAVALAHNPTLLLADEPTGELDSQTAAGIFDVFRSLNETYGVTIVIVTHDIGITNKVDRVVTIRDGRTSLEAIRRRKPSQTGAEPEEAADDFVIVDNVGRLQIPKEYIDRLNLKERVRVQLSEDHIAIWPEWSQKRDGGEFDEGPEGHKTEEPQHS
jgi:ABC-type lipoprotein export system ATPase subunit